MTKTKNIQPLEGPSTRNLALQDQNHTNGFVNSGSSLSIVACHSAEVIGLHAIIEHTGAISQFTCEELESLLTKAALAAKATVLGANFHDFGDGLGNTGVLMLAESHISIHTWPEKNYAAIDIFICSDFKADSVSNNGENDNELDSVEAAINVLRSADKHGRYHCRVIHRAVPTESLDLSALETTDKPNI